MSLEEIRMLKDVLSKLRVFNRYLMDESRPAMAGEINRIIDDLGKLLTPDRV